jgi:hypothetical protein
MGSFGIAYLTKSNKVIKVTTDQNEAKNVLLLKDKKFKHFLNYYDVFSLSLDGKEFEEMSPQDLRYKYSFPKVRVYFILMDYIKPLQGWKEQIWDVYSKQFFNKYVDVEDIMKWITKRIEYPSDFGVTKEEFENTIIPYFDNMIKYQRDEFIREGEKLGISFKDAHSGNLGERKNGTLVYFDIGYSDNIIDMETDTKPDPKNIRKVNLENDFKKIKKMITTKYEMDKPVLLSKVISDISELLGVNKVKSYKYLRDESFSYKNKLNFEYNKRMSNIKSIEYPLYFTYKDESEKWEDVDIEKRSRIHIDPSWKNTDNDIFVVWTENYKKLNI